MSFLRSLFARLFSRQRAWKPTPAQVKDPAAVMQKMRLAWLTRAPDEGTYKTRDDVVSVLMDWPLDRQTVTVLASSLGDASLYTTSTFGIIGGIGHKSVRKAALEFIRCAQHFLSVTNPTEDFEQPDSRTLRFYMVTPAGVRSVSFPMEDTQEKDSVARALYAHGQQVVTELRQITPNQK